MSSSTLAISSGEAAPQYVHWDVSHHTDILEMKLVREVNCFIQKKKEKTVMIKDKKTLSFAKQNETICQVC